MEPSLVALGITLFAAALVPLTYGAYARGAALAYLGMAAWGAGVGLTMGTIFLGATVLAGLVLTTGGTLRLVRHLARDAALVARRG